MALSAKGKSKFPETITYADDQFNIQVDHVTAQIEALKAAVRGCHGQRKRRVGLVTTIWI